MSSYLSLVVEGYQLIFYVFTTKDLHLTTCNWILFWKGVLERRMKLSCRSSYYKLGNLSTWPSFKLPNFLSWTYCNRRFALLWEAFVLLSMHTRLEFVLAKSFKALVLRIQNLGKGRLNKKKKNFRSASFHLRIPRICFWMNGPFLTSRGCCLFQGSHSLLNHGFGFFLLQCL